MSNKSQIVRAAVVLATLTVASLATVPANAAVVCKTAGVPQGCVAVAPAPVVVTPVARPVVGAPVVRRARVVR